MNILFIQQKKTIGKEVEKTWCFLLELNKDKYIQLAGTKVQKRKKPKPIFEKLFKQRKKLWKSLAKMLWKLLIKMLWEFIVEKTGCEFNIHSVWDFILNITDMKVIGDYLEILKKFIVK